MRTIACLLIALLFAPAVSAAEIRVLCSNALNIAAKELAAQFTKETGHQIAFTFGTPGPMQERFDKGEPFELVILPIGGMEASDKAGKFKSGTRQSLVRVGVGVAARQGGTMPDLSSPEGLKKSLLAAKAITYSDSSTGGLSGLSVQKVLANLGIADQIKGKAMAQNEGQAMVGRGEADFGLYNVSEIPRAPGVVLAGPVPRAVQAYIIYDAAIPAANADPAPAAQLVKFFMSPAAQPVWAKAGLEIAKD